MAQFWGILQTVLPVVVIVLCGVLIRRRQMVTDSGMEQIKTVLVRICLPAVLFRAFYAMEFTWRESAAFFVSAGCMLAAFGLGFAARKLLHMEGSMTPWLCTSIEGSSIGYALFTLLFGEAALYHLALLDAGNALVQWTVVMATFAARTSQKQSLKEQAKALVTPINIAIVAGLLCSVTGIGRAVSVTEAGKTVNAVLDFVGAPVSAMIMISVGYGLNLGDVQWRDTLKVAGARALICAVLGTLSVFALGYIFPNAPLYRAAAVVMFILPPSYSYTVYVRGEKESRFLGGFLAVYTLLTIAAFAVVAGIF